MKSKKKMTRKEAVVTIPLSAMKCISSYPKEKKILCEINVIALERANEISTLDEIIKEAGLDYSRGDYKSFTNTDDLIAYLKK